MTDLRNGIICAEGFTLKKGVPGGHAWAPSPETIDVHGQILISANTTLADFRAAFGERAYTMGTEEILLFTMHFQISGAPFDLIAYFDPSGSLSMLEMIPCICYAAPQEDRSGRQEERRIFCDGWLEKQLGTPDRNEGGAKYTFDTVYVGTLTYFDREHGADAGQIVILYKKEGAPV